jgi:hypothetical protein
VKGSKADKFNPSSRKGRDADRYDTGKGSNSKDSRKHVDKYENTREGECKAEKGSLAEIDLSEGDTEEKPSGTCNHADNYRSDSNTKKNGKSADGFGIEGRCKACSADTFGNAVNGIDSAKCKGCNADRFDGQGKNNKNGRDSESFNPSKKSGRDADKYDTGKGSSKDSRKHVDKYESTTEGGCRSSSLAELEECTESQKSDPFSKCYLDQEEDSS